MCELGKKSDYYHQIVLEHCLRVAQDELKIHFIFYGESFLHASESVLHKNISCFTFKSDEKALTKYLSKKIDLQDTVYFKASNATNLKKIVDSVALLF